MALVFNKLGSLRSVEGQTYLLIRHLGHTGTIKDLVFKKGKEAVPLPLNHAAFQ